MTFTRGLPAIPGAESEADPGASLAGDSYNGPGRDASGWRGRRETPGRATGADLSYSVVVTL